MSRQQSQREAKREYWRNVLADWARSGMSKNDYARLHGLDARRLRWWSSQYPHWCRRRPRPLRGIASGGEATDAEEAPSRPASSFVTLHPEGAEDVPTASDSEASADPFRLSVGDITVEVPPGFSEPSLARLLDVLVRRR